MPTPNQNLFRDIAHKKRAFKLVGLLLVILIGVATIALFRRSMFVSPTGGLSTHYPMPSLAAPHPILGDLRVRQGIAHCTNRAELIHSVYPWLEDTEPYEMTSFVPLRHWAYPQNDPSLVSYPFDAEKGKSLFEEAGWRLTAGATYRTNSSGQEMRLTLTTSAVDFRMTWSAAFERQMKVCGLRIEHNRVSGEWLYATGLKRRDFELVAYPWFSQTDPNGRTLYRCDQIPSAENNWQGNNYVGWCNPKADQAIRLATSSLSRETQQTAYRIVQEEYLRDLPSLPLFSRVDVYASNSALQNFAPDSTESLYTWNIGQWIIPGRDTIVIAHRSEPTSLSILVDDSYVTRLIGTLVFGVEYTNLGYDYQPVMLKQIPSIENGMVKVNIVRVREGEQIVDVDGNVVELRPGVHVLDAQGNEIAYRGGTVEMSQPVVKYEFVDGLTWSDGVPVSKDDYALYYRILCNLDTVGEMLRLPCAKMLNVDFVSDTAYVVTWKPGYQGRARADFVGQPYFLPPIGRQPSHQILSDGQRLADVPLAYWPWLPEVNRQPLGTGPYVVSHWEFGKEIVFTANPYYYQGTPATPKIILRFLTPEQAVEALLKGEVDLVDADSLPPAHIETLLKDQTGPKVRLHFIPSIYYELLAFALYAR